MINHDSFLLKPDSTVTLNNTWINLLPTNAKTKLLNSFIDSIYVCDILAEFDIRAATIRTAFVSDDYIMRGFQTNYLHSLYTDGY